MNYEAWNRYVLVAIELFALLLYCGLLYAGFMEFRARVSKNRGNGKRTRSRVAARRLRNSKASGVER